MKSACGLPLIVTFEQHLQPVLKAICRFSPRGKGIVCREDVLVYVKCIAIHTDEHFHDNPLLCINLPRAKGAYLLLLIELVIDVSAANPIITFWLVSRGTGIVEVEVVECPSRGLFSKPTTHLAISQFTLLI